MKVQEVILRALAKKITWWQAAEIIGIDDGGEIGGQGVTSKGDNHTFRLIPCDGNGVEGCDGGSFRRSASK